MQSKNLSPLLLVVLGVLSCSSITAPIGNEITLEPLEKALKITNNGNRIIYFFVVEGETATHINWAPHFDDPHVRQYGSINIEYTEIYNGSYEPVKSGDKIIVYCWDATNKPNPEINNILITL